MDQPKETYDKTSERTSQDYCESSYRMKPNIQINGEIVGRDDPRLEGALNIISLIFEMIRNLKTY